MCETDFIGFLLKEMISHNKIPLNLILFQSHQRFGFYEAIIRLFISKKKWALHKQRGRPSPLQV
jgi:hypothetical protein